MVTFEFEFGRSFQWQWVGVGRVFVLQYIQAPIPTREGRRHISFLLETDGNGNQSDVGTHTANSSRVSWPVVVRRRAKASIRQHRKREMQSRQACIWSVAWLLLPAGLDSFPRIALAVASHRLHVSLSLINTQHTKRRQQLSLKFAYIYG